MADQALYKSRPVFCFTSDVDWAAEAALLIQQKIFDKYDIKATYFITHESPLIRKWHKVGKIDIGIHPNFLPGSSHGDSFDKVIDTVMKLVPDAHCFRAHRCFDVTPVTHKLVKRGLLYDSNLVTNLQQDLGPIEHESGLWRFPVFYEDGTHFEWRRSWDFSEFKDAFGQPGLKVISTHPMITALNVTTPEYWAALKEKFPPDKWLRMTANEIEANMTRDDRGDPAIGPKMFLESIAGFAREAGLTIMTLEELYQNFKNT